MIRAETDLPPTPTPPPVKDNRPKRKRQRRQPKIYLPPSLIIGELFVFKGYFWRLVAGSPDGGVVVLTDQQGKESKGASDNALLVLERYKETGQHLKKRLSADKYNRRHRLVSPNN